MCQVGGLNHNYASATGTPYHIQIEDRGPLVDRVSELPVRRVNVVVYANYGEPNARIVHGRDHDFPDIRTQEHNRVIQQRIQELAAEARGIIEEKERRLVLRIKGLVHEYYLTKSEPAKKEFEALNALYPFLFSRAWMELKTERVRYAEAAPAASAAAQPPAVAQEGLFLGGASLFDLDIVYPLEPDLREKVLDIERIILGIGRDLRELRQRGNADDILLQTCRKLVSRAKESLTGREASEFSARRLDVTRNSLLTTWKQVKSRLR